MIIVVIPRWPSVVSPRLLQSRPTLPYPPIVTTDWLASRLSSCWSRWWWWSTWWAREWWWWWLWWCCPTHPLWPVTDWHLGYHVIDDDQDDHSDCDDDCADDDGDSIINWSSIIHKLVCVDLYGSWTRILRRHAMTKLNLQEAVSAVTQQVQSIPKASSTNWIWGHRRSRPLLVSFHKPFKS